MQDESWRSVGMFVADICIEIIDFSWKLFLGIGFVVSLAKYSDMPGAKLIESFSDIFFVSVISIAFFYISNKKFQEDKAESKPQKIPS